MNENQSNKKGNDDYEKERVETNKAILQLMRAFSKQTIYISLVTFLITAIYVICTCCKTDVKTCIKDTGTAIPLFILLSTTAVEGGIRIMQWAVVSWEQRKDAKEKRDAKLRAEGKAEGRQELLEELKAKGVDTSQIDSKPQE